MKITALFAGVLLALVSGLFSPASAAPARAPKPASCGNSLLCMYTGDGFSGSRDDRLARSDGTCDGVAYNDQISSIWNGSGKSVRFYNDAGCTGQAYSLANGDGSAHLTLSHPTQVDEITSFKWGA